MKNTQTPSTQNLAHIKTQPTPQHHPQSLAHTLQNLPTSPGIYQYYDAKHRVLYIGKAKNLKHRIQSYFSLSATYASISAPIPSANLSARIALMVRQIARIEILVVDSESDALILENSFIKQRKPKYNVLLRDDKTYPYIAFDMGEAFPVPIITRQVKPSSTMRYFGPYPQGAREIVDSLLEFFPLIQRAPSCVAKQRACLFYQIKRCLAPCEGHITTKAYHHIVESAIAALKSPNKLLALLQDKMSALSQNLRFEEAATYRDKINKLSHINTLCVLDLARDISFDLVYFYDPLAIESSEKKHSNTCSNANDACAQDFTPSLHANLTLDTTSSSNRQAILLWLFVRGGKMLSYAYEITHIDDAYSLSDIYTQALLNRYARTLPLAPESIVLPSVFTRTQATLLQDTIKAAQGRKIPFHSLTRGTYARFLSLARENASLLLRNNTHHSELAILEGLQHICELERVPNRIEIFDTSHHSGTACVGGMVVYEGGKFCKESYRRYQLKGIDEYAQMREMLTRRALAFDKDMPPDLWLLDGGKAQLGIAREVLDSSGVFVDVIAIAKEKRDAKAYRAKGKARDSIYTEAKILRLEPSDSRLQFLQQLRDKAHIYAISYHRTKKRLLLTQENALKAKGLSDAMIKRALAIYGFDTLQHKSKQEIIALLRKKPST